jgi:hypothetical protein
MSDECYRNYVLKKTLDSFRKEAASIERQQTNIDDEDAAVPGPSQDRRTTRSSDVSSRNPASKTSKRH